MNSNRTPAGTSAGGEFASRSRLEDDVSLTSPDSFETTSSRGVRVRPVRYGGSGLTSEQRSVAQHLASLNYDVDFYQLFRPDGD